MSYCVLLWGHSSISGRIFGIQRKAVRVVFGLGYRQECQQAFVELRILTLPCLYVYRCLQNVKKNIANYTNNSGLYEYNMRRENDIYINQSRIEKCRTATNFWGPKMYNLLHKSIRDLPTQKFRKRIQDYLVEKAFYSVGECIDGLRAMSVRPNIV